jgi:putative membrane protein
MDMMWGISGMMGFMVIGWLLVLALLVAVVWWLTTNARRARFSGRDDALDILRERYARGEISREEFEARRKDLAA